MPVYPGAQQDKSKARKSDPLTRSATQIEKRLVLEFPFSTFLFDPLERIGDKNTPRYAKRNRERGETVRRGELRGDFFFFFFLSLVLSLFYRFKWEEVSEGEVGANVSKGRENG